MTGLNWDHLHLRGEHMIDKAQQARRQGSPPLTWRTLDGAGLDIDDNRITSTYVENTLLDEDNLLTTQDHLHLRGEHISLLTES